MLSLEHVTVTRQGKRLVDDVSLALAPGTLNVLMGENGAGKSTLLKVASGECEPTSGNVRLDETALSQWKPRTRAMRLAVLAQEQPLGFSFSAREIVLMGRSMHCGGYPGARDQAIADAALARLDVAHLANRLLPTLSGGERGRVHLARVLAQLWEPIDTGPRVLLLDEPVAALDIAHQHLALEVARDFAHNEGAAVLAVLHDLNLAAQYADQVVLMKAGKRIALGTADETLTPPLLSACFSTNIRRLPHPETGRPLLYAA